MARQPARVLEPADVTRLLQHITSLRNRHRNTTMILLSFKAGLRACEIAGLTWPMTLRSDGKVSAHLSIARGIAKYGSGRQVPMHRELQRALAQHHRAQGRPGEGPVIASARGGHMSARGIVNWFRKSYDELGLVGCSSHSGRRTFITLSARAIGKVGGSLRDVQELAGHRALSTTERYIVGDREAQRKLVQLL